MKLESQVRPPMTGWPLESTESTVSVKPGLISSVDVPAKLFEIVDQDEMACDTDICAWSVRSGSLKPKIHSGLRLLTSLMVFCAGAFQNMGTCLASKLP